MKLIDLNSRISDDSRMDVGLKALNLTRLSEVDYIEVPDGFVIPISVLRKVETGEIDIHFFSNLVLEKFNSCFGKSFSGTVAVRSSSPYEDSENKSYAGQYLTKLDVDKNSLIEDIFEVYRSQLFISGYSNEVSPEVAVIIQRMIIPDYSGVLFTKSPNDATEALIEYDNSLLDEFISGHTNAAGRINISRNSIEFLNQNDIFNQIFQKGIKLERELGYYCDIEWAVQGSKIFILQVRPITTLGQVKTYLGNPQFFDSWTSGNVGEVLPGEMSILSWSMFGEMINNLLRKSFKHLSKIYNIDDICFIKLENSQLQYNLGAINYFTNEILGFPKMDEIVGGNNTESLQIDYSLDWKKIFKNFRVILSNNKMFDELPFESEKAYSRIENYVKGYASKDFSLYSTDNLIIEFAKLKKIISEEMFLHTEATSASFSLVCILKYLLKTKNISGNLLTELLSNIKGIEVAQLIPRINMLKQLIPEDESHTIYNILREKDWSDKLTEAGYFELVESIKVLIKDFGHRGNSELELSVPTWGENPSSFLLLILNFWEFNEKTETNDFDIRKIIENNTELNSQNKLYLFLLRKIIEKARLYTRYRENNKHYLYLLVYQLRRIILEFKNRIPKLYIDCFYDLTEDELLLLVKNNFHIDIKAIERRVDQMKVNNLRNPEVYSKSYKNLKGVAASSGIVEGKVRIIGSIKDLDQIKENEILVTKSLDIGWTPALPIVKGIITEIGGVLSHASIIARELGVPAIVNIENATSFLMTGEEVVLDANSGIVFRKIDTE